MVPFHGITVGSNTNKQALKTPLFHTVVAVAPTRGSDGAPLGKGSDSHPAASVPSQPYHPQCSQHGPGARDESKFPDTLLYGNHRQFILAASWASKPSGGWDDDKGCIPLDECMVQALQLEQRKEMPAQGGNLAPRKCLSLAELTLVVIGIKLAHVDMALKGKETTSHLLCNISLFPSQIFPYLRWGVFMAVQVLLEPGGVQVQLPAPGAITCLGGRPTRKGLKSL